MFKKLFVLSMLLFVAKSYGADSLNCRLLGGWFSGPNHAVFVKDTLAFIGDGGYLKILNVKNPEAPVELS